MAGRRGVSSAVPIALEQITEARVSLLRLAAVLRNGDSVRPRGVAMVERLLTDADSFIYTRRADDAVELQVRAALGALAAGDKKGAALDAAPFGGSYLASRRAREAAQV